MPKKDTAKDVYDALFAFQSEMGEIERDAENPYHESKYATMGATWGAIQPLLEKHGMILYHKYYPSDPGTLDIEAVLRHVESRTELNSRVLIPLIKADPQALGSGGTYGRRYTTHGILNLQVDNDDDGNAATGLSKPKGGKRKAPAKKASEEPGVSKTDVLREFTKAINTVDGLKEYYKMNSKELNAAEKAEFKKILSERKKEIEDGEGSE